MPEEKQNAEVCPKCKRLTPHLISITDDNKGKRLCYDCKRKFRREHPDRDFSKISRYNAGDSNAQAN
jgi:ribosomal protein L44E